MPRGVASLLTEQISACDTRQVLIEAAFVLRKAHSTCIAPFSRITDFMDSTWPDTTEDASLADQDSLLTTRSRYLSEDREYPIGQIPRRIPGALVLNTP